MHRNTLRDDDKEMIRKSLLDLKQEHPPDLVVLFQRKGAANITLKIMRQVGLRADVLGGDNLADGSAATFDPDPARHIRVSQFYAPSADDARTAAFEASFREFTGAEPDYGQAFAYDAVYLLRDAMLKRGMSREAIKSYLDDLIAQRAPVNGVGGSFLLGADHDARRPIYISDAGARNFTMLKTLTPEQVFPEEQKFALRVK